MSFVWAGRKNKDIIRALSKESAWIVAGQIIAGMASLVLVRVLTEFLDPSEYGVLSLALTMGTLIGQVGFSGAMPGIMRYYPIAVENGEVTQYFRASCRMMAYGIIIAVCLGAILISSLPLFGIGNIMSLIGLSIAYNIICNINTVQTMIQNAARQRKVVALNSILDSFLRVAITSALIVFVNKTAQMVFVSYIASISIVLISQAYFIRKLIPKKKSISSYSKDWIGNIWEYSKPFAYFNLFTWIQASSDRWALESFMSSSEVGLYSVLLQLGFTPIGMVAGLVATLIGPILFQQSGDTKDDSRNIMVHKKTWQLTFAAVITTLMASLFAIIFHEEIFNLLVSKEYRRISYLLPWMVLAGGLNAAGQMLSLKIMSELNTHAMVLPKITTSLLGTILNYGGAYFAGVTGVVFAAVVFSFIQIVWLGWLSRQPISNKGICLNEK